MNFPDTPTLNQVHTEFGKKWKWNGYAWVQVDTGAILPVVSGGTGTNTSTGSGSVVLSDSPALIGTPTAPTAAKSLANTQLATTAFVKQQFYTPGTSGVLDWNDASNTVPGVGPTLLYDNATNGPGTVSRYYHAFNIEYGGYSGAGNVTQMAIPYGNFTGEFYMRGRYQGGWTSWARFLSSTNFNSYTPTLTGTGASGTWGISVTGNAATVTNGVYTTGSYADPAWITSLAKSKVGLGSVDNTSDASKPVSTATQTALDLKANTGQTFYLGTTSLAINRVSGALSLAGVSIDGSAGSVTNGVYTTGSYADPAWITSLAKSKVGLGSVDNTSDANKPVSTAQQTALNLKANTSQTFYLGTTSLAINRASAALALTGITSIDGNAATVTNGVYTTGSYADPAWITSLAKSKVGLGSVDNTSDANKPVSTAQQTALNLKANLESPSFTGSVSVANTLSVGAGVKFTGTTGGATTVFHNIALSNYASIANGYIKLVTPIRTSHNQMFSIDIVGYDYNVGKSIDFTVVGYAYGASDSIINFGFSNRSSFDREVRLVLEDRGAGYRVLVVALGSETSAGVSNQAWYYQKFSATVRGWAGNAGNWAATDFSFVIAETTLAAGFAETTNLNNLRMDAHLGTITATGNFTAGGFIGPLTGNASTVTNGVYTTGSYADPAWITSLAKSKVGLTNVENTALSTWAGSANITTLGTIATGTWNATTIGIAKGGTGATTAAAALTALAGAERGLFAAGANNSLRALDSRAISNPSTGVGYGTGIRARFSSLNDDSASPYADVLDFSTYNGSSGGGYNALYLGKNSQVILHKYGAAGATTWTTKTLAYADQTMYLGTTQVAINRASGALSLAGVSIDGNAGTVTNGVYTTGSYANPVWITSLAKSKVGLANVDNTSDASKPVSTATQTALDLKADLTIISAIEGMARVGFLGQS